MKKLSWLNWGKALESAKKVRDGLRIIERKQLMDKAAALADHKQTDESLSLLQAYFDKHGDVMVGRKLVVQLLKAERFDQITARPALRACSSREFTLAEHLGSMNMDDTSPVLTEGFAPRLDLAYIGMVKNEEDIILFNLVWHYTLGVRRFFLMDNGSTDQTRHLITAFEQHFADAAVFVLHDPVVAYLQGQKMTAACSFAEQVWPDVRWLLLVDADEFICLHRSWDEVLAEAGDAQALVMPKSVYGLTATDDTQESAHFFHRMPWRKRPFQISNKVIVKAGRAGRAVGVGNHRLMESSSDTQPVRYVSPAGLTMREFPVRSEAQFLSKILNGGRALEAATQAGEAPIGTHWSTWYKQVSQDGVSALHSLMLKQLRNHQAVPLLRDALPIADVMDRMWPGWQTAMDALLAQRQASHSAFIEAELHRDKSAASSGH